MIRNDNTETKISFFGDEIREAMVDYIAKHYPTLEIPESARWCLEETHYEISWYAWSEEDTDTPQETHDDTR